MVIYYIFHHLKNNTKLVYVLFLYYQIDINKIICTNYAKSLLENDFVDNLAEAGLRVLDGFNTNEVDINSKKTIKEGFFEKLFHIFS